MGPFDAVMAILTVHHWTDKAKGMREMRRVSRGPIAVLTFDPAFRDFWLLDYFPELAAVDEGLMPPLDAYAGWLGPVRVAPVLVPPRLHGRVRGRLLAPADGLSRSPASGPRCPSFWKIGDVTPGLERLRCDLEGGAWNHRYGDLLQLEARDCGYRLVVAP